jgi:2-dehydropantoate 2-reductase
MLANNKIKIGVVGPGGIGGLLAILLTSKKFNVVCSNGKIKNKKIIYKLRSKIFGNKSNIIKFEKKKLKNFDIIFICVKYQDLISAIKNIDFKSNKIIVPLLNGLNHISILKKIYEEKIIIANIGKTIAFKEKKNLIIHKSTNYPVITMSSENKKDLKYLDLLKKILKVINFKVKIYNSDNFVIWNKLIRISALSSITALYNTNLGMIRNSKKKKNQLISILRESIKLTNKKNLKFRYKDIIKEIDSFPNSLTTSMQRDIANKKKSEIETLLGGVLTEAKKENLDLKTSKEIYKLLKKK